MTIAIAAVACLAASAIMMSPFMNLAHLATAVHTGDQREQAWAIAWVAHALTNGASLFDANMFFPARGSLAQQDHLIAIAVLGLPVWLATHNAVLTYNVLQILGPAASAFGAFLLAYEWTGDWAASVAGGLAFGLSFFTMLHNAHLNLTWAPGLPLSMLFLERWWRRPTWPRLACLWCAAVFTVLTSGYLAVILLALLAVHAVVLILGERRLDLRARLPQVLVAAAAGAAVLWPVASRYLGQGSVPGETTTFAADLRSYVIPPESTWLGKRLVAHHVIGAQTIWGERTLFLGWTAMALAAIGLVDLLRARGSRTRAWALVAVLVAGVALSFGSSATGMAPFDLLARLPGFRGFRATARFALLATLGTAILAAAGIACVRRIVRAAAPLVTVVAIVLVLGEFFVVDFPAGHPQPEVMPRAWRAARADGARAVIALPTYAGAPDHFKEGDYLLYSTTADFVPLVNGIGRQEPTSYLRVAEAMRSFPSPQSAQTLRGYGVTHVILHRDRYSDRETAQLEKVRRGGDYAIVMEDPREALLRVTAPSNIQGR